MMNGWTCSATIIPPLSRPQLMAEPTHTAIPRGTLQPGDTELPGPSGPKRCKVNPASTDARAYTAPTDKSMPPQMMTKVAPTAMMAMKLVSLASCVRLRAFRNLFLSITTLSVSPAWFCLNSGIRTEPPKRVNSNPSRKITTSKPPSCRRKAGRGAGRLTGLDGLMRWQGTLPKLPRRFQWV